MKSVKDAELLIKYCEPVSNADVELQNCPFEYEYENSPISSPSVTVTPSQPTGILMLSLPSTDSDGQSSAHENEEFETPPEQNNSSQPYFSGSDDLKPSTYAVNHDNNTEAVDLGNDSDDLGFSNRGEIEEQLRKRYRVYKEDLDVKKEPILIEIDQTQTQEVDTEVIECEESIKVYERRIGRNADKSTVEMSEGDGEVRENGERGVDDYEMRENGEKGVDDNEMHENGEKGVDDNEMHENGEKGVDDNEMRENGEKHIDDNEMRKNGKKGIDDNEKLNGVGIGEGNGIKDGDGGRGVVSMNLDEEEKMNGVSAKEMPSNGITRSVDVGVDGGGGGGDVGSVEGRRELPLSMRGGDKNVGLVKEVDGGGAGSVEGRRELPLSMREGDKNVGLVEEVGRRATTKNGSFKDLMEAFSVVVGDVRGDDKSDTDFFETAKRRGLTFPRPRWWPPEGFSD